MASEKPPTYSEAADAPPCMPAVWSPPNVINGETNFCKHCGAAVLGGNYCAYCGSLPVQTKQPVSSTYNCQPILCSKKEANTAMK